MHVCMCMCTCVHVCEVHEVPQKLGIAKLTRQTTAVTGLWDRAEPIMLNDYALLHCSRNLHWHHAAVLVLCTRSGLQSNHLTECYAQEHVNYAQNYAQNHPHSC